MPVQTSYAQKPAAAKAGMIADQSMRDISTVLVDESGGIEPGLFCVQGTNDDDASLPSIGAADPDAIVATGVSTAGTQTLDTAGELDGIIGPGSLAPYARKLVAAIDGHADWNATSWVFTGINEKGQVVSESVATADGGSPQSIKTTNFYQQLLSLVIPAQAGTGGTYDLGYSADAEDVRIVEGHALGVSVLETAREDFAFADDELMGVMNTGRIYVAVENACAKEDGVYVRAVAAGAEKLGAFRAADDDSGDCIFVPNLRFKSPAGAGELAILEIRR